MRTIGLIGGVASGKSEVSRLLAARGAKVLDADRAGHEVLREPAVIDALVGRWGPAILDPEGNVHRQAVAAIVFAPTGEAERQFLNSVSHPRIAARLAEQLRELQAQGRQVAVLDAALLLEAGWDSLCDEIIFVDVPENVRRARAKSRGWDDAEIARRERTQLPLEQKRQRATMVLDNSGTREELEDQVAELWQRWFPGELAVPR